MLLPIQLRLAKPEDINFIVSAWVKNYRHSQFAQFIPDEIFYSAHKGLVLKLIETQRTVIAVNPEDPEQLFGFLCYNELDKFYVTHFLSVKKSFRRLGVAKRMLEETGLHDGRPHVASHRTSAFEALCRKIDRPYIYNPYLNL